MSFLPRKSNRVYAFRCLLKGPGLMGDWHGGDFLYHFLAISFLRSGGFFQTGFDYWRTAFAGMIVLRFKPYIASRFAAWGSVWEYASTTGFQQTRTMSAAASGGLLGMGAGEGWLHHVAAADTDLVFGMVAEELGLIIAVLAVLAIITLAFLP